MVIDYHELEKDGSRMVIYIGLKFEDEPEDLYVALLASEADGHIQSFHLLYNGFDCNYIFKPDEMNELVDYLNGKDVDGRKFFV